MKICSPKMVEEITKYDKEKSVTEYAVKTNSKTRKLVVRSAAKILECPNSIIALPKGEWKTITHKADPRQME